MKEALAVLTEFGIPVKEVIAEVKRDIARATHKDALGKACPPPEAQVAAYVSKHITAAHHRAAEAWIVSTLANAV